MLKSCSFGFLLLFSSFPALREANFYCLADFISAQCDMFMHLIRRSRASLHHEVEGDNKIACEV
jgi:hypothetical protein